MALKHNGRTPAQQARYMLSKMKYNAARSMAERYLAHTNNSSKTVNFWTAVVVLLRDGNSEIINRQASEDDAAMAKQSKQKPTAPANQEPERAAPAQPQAEEQDALHRVKVLIRVLVTKREAAETVLQQFKVALDKDPANAMEWSSGVYEAAARIRVFTQALQPLTNEDGSPKLRAGEADSVDWCREVATEEVMRRSRYASQERSTSPASNIMEREYLAAWADVIEIIKWRT